MTDCGHCLQTFVFLVQHWQEKRVLLIFVSLFQLPCWWTVNWLDSLRLRWLFSFLVPHWLEASSLIQWGYLWFCSMGSLPESRGSFLAMTPESWPRLLRRSSFFDSSIQHRPWWGQLSQSCKLEASLAVWRRVNYQIYGEERKQSCLAVCSWWWGSDLFCSW